MLQCRNKRRVGMRCLLADDGQLSRLFSVFIRERDDCQENKRDTPFFLFFFLLRPFAYNWLAGSAAARPVRLVQLGETNDFPR